MQDIRINFWVLLIISKTNLYIDGGTLLEIKSNLLEIYALKQWVLLYVNLIFKYMYSLKKVKVIIYLLLFLIQQVFISFF